MSQNFKKFFFNNLLLFVFFFICIVGTLTSEYFFTLTNLQNMVRNMAVPGLLALGVSFVFLVSRIDLSVGSLTIFGPILAVSSLAFFGDIFDFKVLVRGNQYANSAAFIVIVSLSNRFNCRLIKWYWRYVWKNNLFHHDLSYDESTLGT